MNLEVTQPYVVSGLPKGEWNAFFDTVHQFVEQTKFNQLLCVMEELQQTNKYRML
jgi:hypothetical protein